MDNLFNGKPSIVLDHRPFFSIIIPCYNSRKTIGSLLQSIIDQNMNNDIEVILSDDNSPESYQGIVDDFKDKLSIKQIMTDYNFAPGNTREKGVSIAEGEWVTFADHDDVFMPNTLFDIKNKIIENNERYYAIANFLEADPETGNVIREMRSTMNWNHAKFYNLDNLWKKFDVHFKKDLLTHEDIYISSTINCIMNYINRKPLFIDLFCYIWNSRPTSVSREKYGDHPFLETFFKDYIDSTGTRHLEMYELNKVTAPYALHSTIEVILYCYFYIQGYMFHDPENYIRDNVDISREFLIKVKEVFNINNEFILNYVSNKDAKVYMQVRESAYIASGPYIENMTFKQWLDYLHKDIKPRITMSQSMSKK